MGLRSGLYGSQSSSFSLRNYSKLTLFVYLFSEFSDLTGWNNLSASFKTTNHSYKMLWYEHAVVKVWLGLTPWSMIRLRKTSWFLFKLLLCWLGLGDLCPRRYSNNHMVKVMEPSWPWLMTSEQRSSMLNSPFCWLTHPDSGLLYVDWCYNNFTWHFLERQYINP